MIFDILFTGKQTGRTPSDTELRYLLQERGDELLSVRKSFRQSKFIDLALKGIAKEDRKPDAVFAVEALSTTDSTSFKKYFVEAVASAERAENKPASKEYWKKRNAAFREARKNKASEEELKALEEEYKVMRKKAKVFSLGDFGNGYKGYAFTYRGIRVVALPKAELTGKTLEETVRFAKSRLDEVYEKSKEEYPGGFSEQPCVPEKTGFVNRFIPLPGDDKKEIARKCVVIASVLVFLAAVWILIYNMVILSLQNAQLYDEIQKVAHNSSQSGDTPDKGDDDSVNWDKLKKINKEIVGWVQLKDTKIDYPVL